MDTKTKVCRHCGEEIEREPTVGWVETRSGDDGGAYDYCPQGPYGSHLPERAAISG